MENEKESIVSADSTIYGEINPANLECEITWQNGTILMDEPKSIGGNDAGPDPYSTLLASLAGCTLATMKLYSNRKEWSFKKISIKLNLFVDKNYDSLIEREISFSDDATEEQKERLLVIANKCPVSRILKGTIEMNSKIG